MLKPVPVAVTLKVAFVPAHWARLTGCVVMAGAVFTVRVAVFDVAVPHVPVTTTS